LRILLCKGHKGYFEPALSKDLGEFWIFEVAGKFHGLMAHLGRKITIIASAQKKIDLAIF
jgi:hypothetical protein